MTGGWGKAWATPRFAGIATLVVTLVLAALKPSPTNAHPPPAVHPSGHEKSEGLLLASDQTKEQVRGAPLRFR